MDLNLALGVALPEVILAAGALLLLVVGAVRGDRAAGR